ncbi:hypothetical protein FACS1894141_7190 [Spirochaetia bacterium]|nr:hypothetical protein FACS1894141_7190 [Spirochaetia bacterium]
MEKPTRYLVIISRTINMTMLMQMDTIITEYAGTPKITASHVIKKPSICMMPSTDSYIFTLPVARAAVINGKLIELISTSINVN